MALPDSPLTRGEQYLSAIAGQDTALPNVPLTRIEQYLAKIAGQDVAVPNVPLTRVEQYLAAIAENGGGGSSITVEPLTVTANGTQTAPSGKAYSPVSVNVPNSYADSDIGKVVNAAKQLEAQRDYYVDLNGTYDTTYYNSATVNVVPGLVYTNEGTGGGTATLANPFPGLDYGGLMNGLFQSTAIWNAFIRFQFQGMDVLFHPFTANNAINAMAFLPNDGQGNPVGAYAEWDSTGLINLVLLSGGQIQDMSSIAASIPCTTTIYGTTAPPPAE